MKRSSRARVHDLLGNEAIPDEEDDAAIWNIRYRQINDYERYLTENGFHVIKFFFNVSKDVQRDRLLERLKDPKKNWEFSFSDVEGTATLGRLSTHLQRDVNGDVDRACPVARLTADDEWYARYIVSTSMIDVFRTNRSSVSDLL